MTPNTKSQQPPISDADAEKEFLFILTRPEREERILTFCAQAHLCMVGRAVITDPKLSKALRRKNSKLAKRISSLEQLPPPDPTLPELGVVLSLAVDSTRETCTCQLGHILSDPMVRIRITELVESHSIQQLWYSFNPVAHESTGEKPEGHQKKRE